MTIQERVECMEKLAAGEWDGNAFHMPADKVETVVTPVEPELLKPEEIADAIRLKAQAIAAQRNKLKADALKLRQEAEAEREAVKKDTERGQSVSRSADRLEGKKEILDMASIAPLVAGSAWGGKQLFGRGMTRNDRLKGGGKVLAGLGGTALMLGGSHLMGSQIERMRQEAAAITEANLRRTAAADEKTRQEEAAIAEMNAKKKEEDKSRNTEGVFMRMPVVKGPATSGTTAKPSWKGFANKKK